MTGKEKRSRVIGVTCGLARSCSRAATGLDLTSPRARTAPAPRALRQSPHACAPVAAAAQRRRPSQRPVQPPRGRPVASSRSPIHTDPSGQPSRGLGCDVSCARDARMRGTWAKPGEARRPNGFGKDDRSFRADQGRGVLSDRESQAAITVAVTSGCVDSERIDSDAAPRRFCCAVAAPEWHAVDSSAPSGDDSRPPRWRTGQSADRRRTSHDLPSSHWPPPIRVNLRRKACDSRSAEWLRKRHGRGRFFQTYVQP